MMVSQCAVGETVLSWQAADGATTFSDRPPFDATDITVRTLSKPSSPVGGFGGTEEWLSDKMHIVVACEVSELAKNELQKAPQKKRPAKADLQSLVISRSLADVNEGFLSSVAPGPYRS